MIIIKNAREIELMRQAGRAAGAVLDEVAAFIQPGVTTRQIDDFGADQIKQLGGKSAFLGYKKFPCHLCLSVNEEVVHGMGSDRRVQFGDIVSVDVGVVLNGFIGDTARTVKVGGCDLGTQKLLDVTEQALYQGIACAKSGNRVVDISRAIQTYVEMNGFSVVREFVGHGVGRTMHEDPQVPNFVETRGQSPKLRPGMTIAIEPMANAGLAGVEILKDGWTVVTKDRKVSAHFEHTVLITEGDAEILTCPAARDSRLTEL